MDEAVLDMIKVEADAGRPITISEETAQQLGNLDAVGMWCNTYHVDMNPNDDGTITFIPYPKLTIYLDTLRSIEWWLSRVNSANGGAYLENVRATIANLLLDNGYHSEE